MSEVKGVRAKGQVSESNFQCIEFFVFQIQRGWALSTDQRTTKILPEECDFTVQFSYHLNIDAMGYSNTSSLHNGYTRLCWHMGFVVLCIIIQCLSHTSFGTIVLIVHANDIIIFGDDSAGIADLKHHIG